MLQDKRKGSIADNVPETGSVTMETCKETYNPARITKKHRHTLYVYLHLRLVGTGVYVMHLLNMSREHPEGLECWFRQAAMITTITISLALWPTPLRSARATLVVQVC